MIDDEEVTDVRPILQTELEAHPADITAETTVPAGLAPELTEEATPPDAQRLLRQTVRLPRTGVNELDQALRDLEGLLDRLDEQSARLLAVSCLTFVSLFVPWHNVTTPGFQQGVPGIELGGVLLILLILAEMTVIGFERNLRQRFSALATWLRQGTIVLVVIALSYPLLAPDLPQELSHRPSLWALVPAIAVVAQAMGLFGVLPSLRRRAVARTKHKE